MAVVKYKFGTEAQILALKPTDDSWVDRAFYYPDDKGYFYQALNDEMVKYGGGEDSGVGIRINGDLIGGVKSVIEENEVLDIPENFEYNIFRVSVYGTVNCNGTINMM